MNESETFLDGQEISQQQKDEEKYLGEPRQASFQRRTLLPVQQRINANYQSFRESAPFLYDYLTLYGLSSPSRTIEFVKNDGNECQLENYRGYSFVIASKTTEFSLVTKKTKSKKAISAMSTLNESNENDNQSNSDDNRSLNNRHRYRKAEELFYLQSLNCEMPIEDNFASGIERNHLSLLENGEANISQVIKDGGSVKSTYDVYRLKIHPQRPNIIATRSTSYDIALYWIDHSVDNCDSYVNNSNDNNNSNDITDRTNIGTDYMNDRICKSSKMDDYISDPPKKRRRLNSNRSNNTSNDQSGDNDDMISVTSVNSSINGSLNERMYNGVFSHPRMKLPNEKGFLIGASRQENGKEGWGIAWNPKEMSKLISGNNDGQLIEWDLNRFFYDIEQSNNEFNRENDNTNGKTKRSGKRKYSQQEKDAFQETNNETTIENMKYNDWNSIPYIKLVANSRDNNNHLAKDENSYPIFESCSSYYISSEYNNQKDDASINCIDWRFDSSNLYCCVSGSGFLNLIDNRLPLIHTNIMKPASRVIGFSQNPELLSVSWNKKNPNLIATAGKDGGVRIWDARRLNRQLLSYSNMHTDCIYDIKWFDGNSNIFATASADSIVHIWDLRRVGLTKEQNFIDNPTNTDPPPNKDDYRGYSSQHRLCSEIVFSHFGHCGPVTEISWCPSNDLTIASTDMQGCVQIWKPSYACFGDLFDWISCCNLYTISSDKRTMHELIGQYKDKMNDIIPKDDACSIKSGESMTSGSKRSVSAATAATTTTAATAVTVATGSTIETIAENGMNDKKDSGSRSRSSSVCTNASNESVSSNCSRTTRSSFSASASPSPSNNDNNTEKKKKSSKSKNKHSKKRHGSGSKKHKHRKKSSKKKHKSKSKKSKDKNRDSKKRKKKDKSKKKDKKKSKKKSKHNKEKGKDNEIEKKEENSEQTRHTVHTPLVQNNVIAPSMDEGTRNPFDTPPKM